MRILSFPPCFLLRDLSGGQCPGFAGTLLKITANLSTSTKTFFFDFINLIFSCVTVPWDLFVIPCEYQVVVLSLAPLPVTVPFYLHPSSTIKSL